MISEPYFTIPAYDSTEISGPCDYYHFLDHLPWPGEALVPGGPLGTGCDEASWISPTGSRLETVGDVSHFNIDSRLQPAKRRGAGEAGHAC